MLGKVRPFLSVMVPTIGRYTLEDTLRSIASQPKSEEVEVIVVADTHGRRVDPIEYVDLGGDLFGLHWYNYDAGFNCYGHPQRNFAMPRATGEYIVSLDDDDTWDPHALEAIRDAAESDVDPRLHIFKMRYKAGDELWRWPTVMFGNIGTPMMVFPNNRDQYGQWGRAYEGDFLFLQTTVANMGIAAVAWHDTVIAHIRPVALA